MSELTPLDLQDLYDQLLTPREPKRPLSAGTVRNLHLALTQALGQATRWQLLSTNPANGAQPPRPRRPQPRIADPPLIKRILASLTDHPLQLPVAIAVATGMRRGEILALRWSDLDADYTTARIQQTLQPSSRGLTFEHPKTHRSQRTVALPTFLTPYLQQQRNAQTQRRETLGSNWHEHRLINDNGNGQPINPDTLSSSWRRFLHQHQLPPLRFHDLRHSHATLMLIAGIHPKIVSERLGHASIGITLDTYSHVLPNLQTEATNAFDKLFPAESHSPSTLSRDAPPSPDAAEPTTDNAPVTPHS